MVLAHGHVDGRGITSWDKKVTSGFLAAVVIEHFLCAAAEDDHLFAGHGMSMDRNNRPWLNGVQHPLGVVV